MKERNMSTRYDVNAWRYYSEYNVHMYGWELTGWALDKNWGVISDIAEKTKRADVFANKPDNRWYVNLLTVLAGILGM